MYAERRLAFEKRIGELLSDHLKAVGPLAFHGPQMLRAKKAFFNDLTPRILSALEDSFQMGRRDTNSVNPTDEPKPQPTEEQEATNG